MYLTWRRARHRFGEVIRLPISSRIEDYMEEIFALEISGREATVTDLANALGVAKATVVAAVRRLSEASMVSHERYGAFRLTEKGRERALRIHRRHEHLTFLFEDILGFDKKRAQAMACVLEHEMDEEAEVRIMGFTDYLARAQKEGREWVKDLLSVMGDERKLPRPLAMIPEGEKGVVTRVTAEEPLRGRLFSLGLSPGAAILRLAAPPGDELVNLEADGNEITLKMTEAASVWICTGPDRGPYKRGGMEDVPYNHSA
ncbi:MAG: metal-dependent transcriptional regulator [Synergistaceae bacterium]|nr:metal-dependent transcriptional regulator [Synergistaceae bacterium]